MFFIAKGEHGLQHHPGCFDVDHGQIGILDGCGRTHQTCLGDGIWGSDFFSAWEGHKKSWDFFVTNWFLLVEFDFWIIKLFVFWKKFCSCGLGWNIETSGHCMLWVFLFMWRSSFLVSFAPSAFLICSQRSWTLIGLLLKSWIGKHAASPLRTDYKTISWI